MTHRKGAVETRTMRRNGLEVVAPRRVSAEAEAEIARLVNRCLGRGNGGR